MIYFHSTFAFMKHGACHSVLPLHCYPEMICILVHLSPGCKPLEVREWLVEDSISNVFQGTPSSNESAFSWDAQMLFSSKSVRPGLLRTSASSSSLGEDLGGTNPALRVWWMGPASLCQPSATRGHSLPLKVTEDIASVVFICFLQFRARIFNVSNAESQHGSLDRCLCVKLLTNKFI